MISSIFELWIFISVLVGCLQLSLGYTKYAFYTLGSMIIIVLMAILGYIREIYLRNK